jgi:hypothetical protein
MAVTSLALLYTASRMLLMAAVMYTVHLTVATGEPDHLVISKGHSISPAASATTPLAAGGVAPSSAMTTPYSSSLLADYFSGGEAESIVCTCMCCLQGACVPIANATWMVPSCGFCRQDDCLQRAADLDAISSSSETSRRRVSRSPCFVLHTTERKTCSGMTERQCRRFTSIKSKCVQRSSLLQTMCCLGWTVVVLILLLSHVWRKYVSS